MTATKAATKLAQSAITGWLISLFIFCPPAQAADNQAITTLQKSAAVVLDGKRLFIIRTNLGEAATISPLSAFKWKLKCHRLR